MVTRKTSNLTLSLIFHIFTTAAALPLNPPFSAAPLPSSLTLTTPLSDGLNASKYMTASTGLSSFPPGPPPSRFTYAIFGSDLTLEINTLGLIRDRDESLVEKVLNDAFRASINPFRPSTGLPQAGYQLQEGRFLLGVAPSRTLPGEKRVTWGMWTEVLTGIHGYAEAYPGYDFSFDIWWTPQVGSSQGYVIGTGLAKTRRR